MTQADQWYLFVDNWFMSATMMVGSFIAGSTSMGGGAVAFPVMTLGFGMEPLVARDFSLMIQSIGMVSASLVIIIMRINVEWQVIIYASIGGALGIIFGIEWVAPLLSSSSTKIFFVSFWLGFGTALYWINRNRTRTVNDNIENLGLAGKLFLFIVGLLGGIVSGLVGSGLDIMTFSVLVLVFRLCERVATPTSVILMACNSVIGFLWLENAGTGVAAETWNYWWVCIPVVVVGAPLGARFIRNRSRHFIAGLLYYAIAAQYIVALLIIPQDSDLLIFNFVIVVAATVFFTILAYYGNLRHKKIRLVLPGED